MKPAMETTLDQFGRVVIPKRVRKRLGLEPGDVLRVVEDQGRIRLDPLPEESALAWKDGILVHHGVPTGDLEEALRRDREERIRHLAGLPAK
jgi:AbrB family looped-hinge helix DNA binding protein